MTLWRLIGRTLWYHRRSDAAVLVGLSLAGAVVTGALVIGDSMRGTLRDRAFRRLGPFDVAMRTADPVTTALTERLSETDEWRAAATGDALPLLHFPGTVEPLAGDLESRPMSRATVYGVGPGFLEPFADMPAIPPRTAFCSPALLQALGDLESGSYAVLKLAPGQGDSTASIFGARDRDRTIVSIRVRVESGLPDQLAAFAPLTTGPGGQDPRAVFLDLAWLQAQLGLEGRANLVIGRCAAGEGGVGAQDTARLSQRCASLAGMVDRGLSLTVRDSGEWADLRSSRLLIDRHVVEALASLGGIQTSVHLANRVRCQATRGRSVPYAVIAAGHAPDGRNPSPFPELTGDQAAVSQWLADESGCAPGRGLELEFYAIDQAGETVTLSRNLWVDRVLPMEHPAVDPAWVPPFEGVTDIVSMREWDPPFPLDLDLIQDPDERYWDEYRTAPKLWVSPETMQALWQPFDDRASGTWVTGIAYRLESPGDGSGAVPGERLGGEIEALLQESVGGFGFRSLRTEALNASQGASDFGSLFLGLSLFVLASAFLFAGMVIRLTVDLRAAQTGLLLVVGIPRKLVARALFLEILLMAIAGGVLGLVGGVGYGRLMLYLVNTRWYSILGASGGLETYLGQRSLLAAPVVTLAFAVVVGHRAASSLRQRPLLSLLSGYRAMRLRHAVARAGNERFLVPVGSVLVAVCGLASVWVNPALACFGAGASLMIVGVGALVRWMRRSAEPASGGNAPSSARLVRRALGANLGRSALTMTAVACAVFVIVVVAANRLDPLKGDLDDPKSPAGGYRMLVRTALPLFEPLEQAVESALGPDERRPLWTATACRVFDGDEISCLNLERPSLPRVIGVGRGFIDRAPFGLQELLTPTEDAAINPWQALYSGQGTAEAVPAFVDAESARWVLRMSLGDTLEIPGGRDGRTVRLRIAGLLEPSFLAGELIVADDRFVEVFGDQAGYSLFLIACGQDDAPAVRRLVSTALASLGPEVESVRDRLVRLAAVQNTYLSAFTSLGGVGLFLGLFGLLVLVVRSADEHRMEYALRRALGTGRMRVALELAAETGALLGLGLALGLACGLVAVSHRFVTGQAGPAWGELVSSVAGVLVAGSLAGVVTAFAATRRRGALLADLRNE